MFRNSTEASYLVGKTIITAIATLKWWNHQNLTTRPKKTVALLWHLSNAQSRNLLSWNIQNWVMLKENISQKRLIEPSVQAWTCTTFWKSQISTRGRTAVCRSQLKTHKIWKTAHNELNTDNGYTIFILFNPSMVTHTYHGNPHI